MKLPKLALPRETVPRPYLELRSQSQIDRAAQVVFERRVAANIEQRRKLRPWFAVCP